jgi:hypothetical protein
MEKLCDIDTYEQEVMTEPPIQSFSLSRRRILKARGCPLKSTHPNESSKSLIQSLLPNSVSYKYYKKQCLSSDNIGEKIVNFSLVCLIFVERCWLFGLPKSIS